MEFWIKAAQLFLSLSILIILHELGHFIPAKLFKTRVEKFYLFFDAGFSLFKIKKGETEYGIGWIPLGGYVKIAGMIDESMDKEAMKEEPKPWEFRSKPAWQRLIIMIGGVVVNVILGFVIYSGILMHWGEDVLPSKNVTYGMHADSLMTTLGFQDGDKILKLDGKPIANIDNIGQRLMFDKIKTVTVERDKADFDVTLPNDLGQLMLDNGAKRPFELRFPVVVEKIASGSNAEAAGLEAGDSIVTVNGLNKSFFIDFSNYLHSHQNQEIIIGYYRDGKLMNSSVKVTDEGTIGFVPKKPKDYFKLEHVEYTFFSAIPRAITKVKETVSNYFYSLKFIFSKAGIKQLGSFGTFGDQFAPHWDWQVFWEKTALFSLILAVMNILPIPALDGGHVMFLIYEMITGKPPKEKFMERAQMIGMILLLTLMVYALGNDLWRFVLSKYF